MVHLTVRPNEACNPTSKVSMRTRVQFPAPPPLSKHQQPKDQNETSSVSRVPGDPGDHLLHGMAVKRQRPMERQTVGQWLKVSLARGYLRLRQEGHVAEWLRDGAGCVAFLVTLLSIYILVQH